MNEASGDSMPTNASRPRLYFVYVLNILSCIAVVTLQTTLSVYTPKPTGAWVWAVVLQSIAIFAVPIFFMISGMNLLGYRRRESTAQFMRKRCWKIGKALVLGSIVCYVVFCLFPYSFFGAEQYVGTGGMIDFCRRFMSNHINDVYWFLYSIIYLYVLTPILSLAVGNKRCLQYMLALCGLVGVLVPLANRLGVNPMYTGTVFNWPLFSTVPLLYFLAGYYLHTYWRPIRHQAAIAAAAYVAATIGMAVLGLWSNGYYRPGGPGPAYDAYVVGISSPFCVVQACALFLLFQSCETRLQACRESTKRMLGKMAGASLGVYMFHILFINWTGFGFVAALKGALAAHPVLYAAVIYLCTLAVVLVGKAVLVRCAVVVRQVREARKNPVAHW